MRSNRLVQSPSVSSNAVASAPMPPPKMATDPLERPTSNPEKTQRLGQFGTRRIGRELRNHGANPATPVGRPITGQPSQVVGRPQREDQGPLGQADLDRGDQILHRLVRPTGIGSGRDLGAQAEQVWLMDA